MGRLIIMGGASGAGKSFLLENMARLDSTIEPVLKYTTRKPRPYETKEYRLHLDLVFDQSLATVQECDYVYRYAGNYYGTQKADIDAVLNRDHNPLLIVRDAHTIHRVLRDYPTALVLYLQSGLSGADLRSKIAELGLSDIDIKERLERQQQDYHQYVAHIHLFRHVLINYYDETLIDQMRVVMRYAIPEDVVIPDFVFVLMAFDQKYDEVFAAIRSAGKLLNGKPLTVERIDLKKGGYRVTDEILRKTRQAALIVSDLTESNLNVYYETGYAHGIGKQVLQCARAGTELPFDVKDWRTVFYTSPMDLQAKLVEEFRHAFPEFVG